MIRFFVCALFACLAAPAALGQPGVIEWSSTARIANGTCGDGALARMTEKANSVNVKILIGGKVTTEFDMPLAADGSGKGDYRGVMGRQKADLAPGRGKRLMTTAQVEGNCQWRWLPD
jgi:hypothetical protein